jgi:hypothetical protein
MIPEMIQIFAFPSFLHFWIISNLVDRLDKSPCCPGKKAGAEAEKGREKPSRFSPLCFRKQTRGESDTRAETAEARVWKRDVTAFFGEANAFLPGHGAISPSGILTIRKSC